MIEIDQGIYESRCADVLRHIDTWTPLVRDPARSLAQSLFQGEFCKTVAMLPYLLQPLFPVSDVYLRHLSVAHIMGWLFYASFDAVLDGDAGPDILLPGHLAWLSMISIYHDLPLQSDAWAFLHMYSQQSALGYAKERGVNAHEHAFPTHDQLLRVNESMIQERAGAFFVNSRIQCLLAGKSINHQPATNVWVALEALNLARQYDDDATDWASDLQGGYANIVGASILRQLLSRGVILPQERDIEVVAGWLIHHPDILFQIAQRPVCVLEDALAQPLSDCRSLKLLLERQYQTTTKYWDYEKRYIQALRTIFMFNNIQLRAYYSSEAGLRLLGKAIIDQGFSRLVVRDPDTYIPETIPIAIRELLISHLKNR